MKKMINFIICGWVFGLCFWVCFWSVIIYVLYKFGMRVWGMDW